MSKVLVTDSYLMNIANAIRDKNGSTTKYKPSAMASAISAISTSGGESSGVDLSSLDIYVTDYMYDEVTVTAGAIDIYERNLVS